MTFRIGIDSYSYHRLVGGLRPGETLPNNRLPNAGAAVMEEAHAVGAEYVSLETMFLDHPTKLALDEIAARSGDISFGFSWGGADGFAFGTSDTALSELSEWLDISDALGARLLRIVVGGPRLRGQLAASKLRATAESVSTAADYAAAYGIELAIENHGDINACEAARLVKHVDRPNVGICFDTANALRVDDDPLDALERLLPLLRMVHLKDCSAHWSDQIAGPLSVAYGEGVIPVDRVVERLLEMSFVGPVCVELGQLGPHVDERALVRQGIAWLRERRTSEGDVAGGPG